jgi:hypothetical protein
MRTNPISRASALAILLGVLLACPVSANPLGGGTPQAFVPRVPVSAFAYPVSWLDPSRLHVSSIVSVGSGFGNGTNALQVTRLSYAFKAPIRMSVSVGNAWGAQSAGSSAMFLEGLDLSFRPSNSTIFEFRFQNVRSPLQYSSFSRSWIP